MDLSFLFDHRDQPNAPLDSGFLIRQAQALAVAGFWRAGGSIGRTALELAIYEACDARGVQCKRDDGSVINRSKARRFQGRGGTRFSYALLDAGYFSLDDAKLVWKMFNLGARAAHPRDFSADKAFLLIHVAKQVRAGHLRLLELEQSPAIARAA